MIKIKNFELYNLEKHYLEKFDCSVKKSEFFNEVVNNFSSCILDTFQKKELNLFFNKLIKKLDSTDLNDEIFNKIKRITENDSELPSKSKEENIIEEDITYCRVKSLFAKANYYQKYPEKKYNVFLNYNDGHAYLLYKKKYDIDGKRVFLGEGHLKKAKLSFDWERNKSTTSLIAKMKKEDLSTRERLINENKLKNTFSNQYPDLFPSVYCSFFISTKSGDIKWISIEDKYSNLKEMLVSLSTKEKLIAFRSIIEVISALHKMGYIHRDIKLENLLGHRNMDGDFVVKPTDFELTIPIHMGFKYQNNHEGTHTFFSPERWKPDCIITAKDDVWATGITLLNLLWITPPWRNTKNREMVANSVQSLKIDWLDDLCNYHPIVRTELWPILKKMLSIDPSQRADMDEVNSMLERITSKDEEIIKILESPLHLDSSIKGPYIAGCDVSIGKMMEKGCEELFKSPDNNFEEKTILLERVIEPKKSPRKSPNKRKEIDVIKMKELSQTSNKRRKTEYSKKLF